MNPIEFKKTIHFQLLKTFVNTTFEDFFLEWTIFFSIL